MVNTPKNLTFTLTNHSTKETLRYCWKDMPHLKFSPSCGHLPPSCAKDIAITYHSLQPHVYDRENIPCKVEAIVLTHSSKKKVSVVENKRTFSFFGKFRLKIEYGNAPFSFCPQHFSIFSSCRKVFTFGASHDYQ